MLELEELDAPKGEPCIALNGDCTLARRKMDASYYNGAGLICFALEHCMRAQT